MHQNCIYPYANVEKNDAVTKSMCCLKTIDMSVEDEMLCQLEAEEHEHMDGKGNPANQHHPHYSLLPRAVSIASTVLTKAVVGRQADLVGMVLGGAATSNGASVAEKDIHYMQFLANTGSWEEWTVLTRQVPENPAEGGVQRLMLCSFLLLDWLESRSDGLFSTDSLRALESMAPSSWLEICREQEGGSVRRRQEQVQQLDSMEHSSETDTLRSAPPSVESVLRGHMSRCPDCCTTSS